MDADRTQTQKQTWIWAWTWTWTWAWTRKIDLDIHAAKVALLIIANKNCNFPDSFQCTVGLFSEIRIYHGILQYSAEYHEIMCREFNGISRNSEEVVTISEKL
jgi:hypothetical protein